MNKRILFLCLMALLITNTYAYSITTENGPFGEYIDCVFEDTGLSTEQYNITLCSAINGLNCTGTTFQDNGSDIYVYGRKQAPSDFTCNGGDSIVCYAKVMQGITVLYDTALSFDIVCGDIKPEGGGVNYEIENNQLTCTETLDSFSENGYWDVYAEYNNTMIGTPHTISFQQQDTDITNSVSVDISLVPCGGGIVCYSNLHYASNVSQSFYAFKSFIKNCIDQPTTPNPNIFGNITQGTNHNITGNNFGTMPYNASGNLSAVPKILGLSVGFFMKLGALIILTILLITIKPVYLALMLFLIALNLLTETQSILDLNVTVVVLITFLVLIEILRKVRT